MPTKATKATKATKPEGHRIDVRPMRAADIPQIQALQRRCFPGIEPWGDAHFLSQIARFPEGQIVIDFDGRIAATSSSLIVATESYDRQHTLKDVSGDGHITTHNLRGDALYGIDIAVDEEFRGLRLARRIYEARKQIIIERNLRRFLIAGRIPGYHKVAGTQTAKEYVRSVIAKEQKDPVLTIQLANGFVVRSVLSGYLPSDHESRGHAVLMEWLNPEFVPVGDQATGTARVASVQYQMRSLASFDEFARQVEFFVDTAAEYHSDFVIFPELLTNQLQVLVTEIRPGLTARRMSEFTPAYIELFNRLAIAYNINIIGGTILTVEDDVLYNIAYLFHRDGGISKQKKIHITPAEARWWGVSAGNSIDVIETDCGPVGISICYDIEFPEQTRIQADKGANIIFIPFNTDIRSGYLRVRSCAQARCIENHVYCVLSGACGNLPHVEGADVHYAQSCILTPSDIPFSRDGIAAEATPNVETLVIHDLDLDLLRRTRASGAVRTWDDRRTDLYKVVYRDGDQEYSI